MRFYREFQIGHKFIRFSNKQFEARRVKDLLRRVKKLSDNLKWCSITENRLSSSVVLHEYK